MSNAKATLFPLFFAVAFLGFHSLANAKEPPFELHNGATHGITVEIVHKEHHFRTHLSAGERVSRDISKDSNIVIQVQDETNRYSFKPDYRFEIKESAHGKTKYLTWDPSKRYRERRLRPQTGYSKGIMFYSDKGFNSNNNVNESDIKLVD